MGKDLKTDTELNTIYAERARQAGVMALAFAGAMPGAIRRGSLGTFRSRERKGAMGQAVRGGVGAADQRAASSAQWSVGEEKSPREH